MKTRRSRRLSRPSTRRGDAAAECAPSLDPSILIAALLSPTGAPAQIVARWLAGEFELVVSEALLVELERAVSYPTLRRRIAASQAAEFVALLRHGAILATDPPSGAHRSTDVGDDDLIALAEAERAVLVSGDHHLLALAESFRSRRGALLSRPSTHGRSRVISGSCGASASPLDTPVRPGASHPAHPPRRLLDEVRRHGRGTRPRGAVSSGRRFLRARVAPPPIPRE